MVVCMRQLVTLELSQEAGTEEPWDSRKQGQRRKPGASLVSPFPFWSVWKLSPWELLPVIRVGLLCSVKPLYK